MTIVPIWVIVERKKNILKILKGGTLNTATCEYYYGLPTFDVRILPLKE